MNPTSLACFWLPLKSLPSLARRPAVVKALGEVGIKHLWELLLWAPRRFILLPSNEQPPIFQEERGQDEAPESRWRLLKGRLHAMGHPFGPRKIWRYALELDHGVKVQLVCFYRPHWDGWIGQEMRALGTLQVDPYSGVSQMVHPHLLSPEHWEQDLAFETLRQHGHLPIYPEIRGCPQLTLRRIMAEALQKLEEIDETLWKEVTWELPHLPTLKASLILLHGRWPSKFERDPEHFMSHFQRAKRRLGLEEFLAFHLRLSRNFYRIPKNFEAFKTSITPLALASIFENPQSFSTEHVASPAAPLAQWLTRLPFSLRPDQAQACVHLLIRMQNVFPMKTLLLGDVGSGKTVVSMVAARFALLEGRSILVVAPSVLLAHQHHANFLKYFSEERDKIHLVTGETKKKAEPQTLEAGSILITTQASFYRPIQLEALGLVIIDEQQRFGIKQKHHLTHRLGESHPHQLMMSATPIPRTFHMAQCFPENIVQLSLPSERIAQRHTHLLSQAQLSKLIDRLSRASARSETEGAPDHLRCMKVYWVCGRIHAKERKEEDLSEVQEDEQKHLGLRSVDERWEFLKQDPRLSSFTLLRLDGSMSDRDKLETLARFKVCRCAILVCTTAVEVGIDVSDANILVVEHPDLLGLAQIHQLRGRVGRSGQTSYCFLIVPPNPAPSIAQRLEILKHHAHGHEITEWDLKLRGQGETFSLKQSGVGGDFRFFRGFENQAELLRVFKEAKLRYEKPPQEGWLALWRLPLADFHHLHEDEEVSS